MRFDALAVVGISLASLLAMPEKTFACQCADDALISKSECSSKGNCADLIEESRKTQAVLIVKGKMQSVLVGASIDQMASAPGKAEAASDSNASSVTRSGPAAEKFIEGRFEITKVIKGDVEGKTIKVVTGFGMGDCGLLSQFIGVYYYGAEMELGISQRVLAGKTVYYADMCSYQRYPQR